MEEVVRAKVKKVVFASTNHTQNGENMINSNPETMDIDAIKQGKRMKTTDTREPDSFYAVSKLFGEDLGKYYCLAFGIKFIALRIGWIVKSDSATEKKGTDVEHYLRCMYLSHRDCVQAFEKAIESEFKYLVAYAVSNNTTRIFDLEDTIRDLGFIPQDNSEDHFNLLI